MTNSVFTKAYSEPPINIEEILRYADCRGEADDVRTLAESCIDECRKELVYRVCRCEVPVSIIDRTVDFSVLKLESSYLAKHLEGCSRAIIFAATVGMGIDRLIARYGKISPAKALMFQAIGAERIESLCDEFCNELKAELKDGEMLRPRYSPGYGDIPLSAQADIFRVLDCPRKIGLSLNESLLMSPSKSVTAIVGIGGGIESAKNSKCIECKNTGCSFRRE